MGRRGPHTLWLRRAVDAAGTALGCAAGGGPGGGDEVPLTDGDPSGDAVHLRHPPEPLPETLAGRRYVVLDAVQDPGNVGTILRTADAFHADGMFLVNGCADLYNPKTLRATMGAVFRCPVWTVRGGGAVRSAEKERHSSLRRGAAGGYPGRPCGGLQPLRHCHRQRGPGTARRACWPCCDRTIKIPMSEHCESLNAAAAAAVLLWEAARND